jgi:hypothetical protein
MSNPFTCREAVIRIARLTYVFALSGISHAERNERFEPLPSGETRRHTVGRGEEGPEDRSDY